MPIIGTIDATWVDVDTYVELNPAGRPLQELDGDYFKVNSLQHRGSLGYLEGFTFPYAIVSFEGLVYNDFHIGDRLNIEGELEGGYVTTADQVEHSQKLIATALAKLIRTARGWSDRNVKGTTAGELAKVTKHLRAGDLSGEAWLRNQQLVLFGKQPPSANFLKYAQHLRPLITQYDNALAKSAPLTLMITNIASVSSYRPQPPGEWRIIRETFVADTPMRDNYEQEWEKYRKEAAAYRTEK